MENELRSLHLDPNVTSAPFAPLTGLRGATALDYDYADGTIVFSQVDGQRLSTMRASDPQGSVADLVVHSNSTGMGTGMTTDVNTKTVCSYQPLQC